MIAKCGTIVSWHWAHEADECDPWAEPESEWHRAWKAKFPATWVEQTVGDHRADVLRSDGIVIEFQKSFIDPDEIRLREQHYGKMLWVFDMHEPYDEDRLLLSKQDYGHSFRWKHPRKSYWAVRRGQIWDLGDDLFQCKRIHHEIPCGGWGHLLERNTFCSQITTCIP